mgnify:CR=1 FL=1
MDISANFSATAVITLPERLVAGTGSTTTVAHGRTQPPAYIAYTSGNTGLGIIGLEAGNYNALPGFYPLGTGTDGADGLFRLRAYTDATNFYVTFENLTRFNLTGFGGSTISIKYYLLAETALPS